MLNLIRATLVAAFAAWIIPAAAQEPAACRLAQEEPDTARKSSWQQRCIEAQAERLREQQKAILGYRTVLQRVWKVAGNPSELVNLLDLTVVREPKIVGTRFQALYENGRELLDPGTERDADSFEPLRTRFSDPTALRAFYDLNKSTMLGKIATVAIRGVMSDSLAAGMPLFDKPLTLAAAQASSWYSNECWKQEADQSEYYRDTCKKLRAFPIQFKDDYGVEATPDNAYVLGWLYRRHLEGGARLVAEWQRIGKELASEF